MKDRVFPSRREKILLWIFIWFARATFIGMIPAFWIIRGWRDSMVVAILAAIGIAAVEIGFARPLKRAKAIPK